MEGALNAFQKQMEEQDQRLTEFQSSMVAILNKIQEHLDTRDQSLGGGNRDQNPVGGHRDLNRGEFHGDE